ARRGFHVKRDDAFLQKRPRMMSATSSRRKFLTRGMQSLGLVACAGGRAVWGRRADDPIGAAGSSAESARKMMARGIAFLRPGKDATGGWSPQREAGITALVVTALLRSGQVPPGDPAVTKALAYLEGFIGPKGGLSEGPHANYSTPIAILAFREANVNGRYD